MTGIARDLALALRLFRQQPGFTAVALIIPSLGIGGTTAIFSVVNAVILRPLPFEQSEKLVLVFENARPYALLAQVLQTGVLLAAAGASLGLVAAWMLGDVVSTLLFQTAPHDALTFGVVSMLLLATAGIACYLPARRAARVDPIEALREE